MGLKNKSLCILIISYDGAEELWNPFSITWKRNWPNCPFEINLITQSKEQVEDSCFDRIITIPSQPTKAIFRIREALKQIDSEYILVMCDDYFLYQKPQEQVFYEVMDLMEEKELSCVHLYNKSKYSGKVEMKEIPNKNFMVSGGVPSIYKKEFLNMLCEKFIDCSMREWELSASRWLQENMYGIQMVENSAFFCHHCVLEGYWRVKPYNWLKKNKIDMICQTYKKPTLLHSIKAWIKAVLFNIVVYVFPQTYQKWTKKKYQ